MKLNYKCAKCEKTFKTLPQLSHHIPTVHNITVESYYEKYVRKDNEGICPICGNKTKFLGFLHGYSKHCSRACSNNDPETKRKYTETCLALYKVPHALMNEDVKKIQKEAMRKNGGFTLERKNLKKIVDKAMEDKYGDKHYLRTRKGQKRFKKTMLKKHGVDNPLRSKKLLNKQQDTLFKNHGVRNPQQDPDIRQRTEKTNLERYGYKSLLSNRKLMEQCYVNTLGVKNPFQSEEVKEKIKKYYLDTLGVSHPMKDRKEFMRRMIHRKKKYHGYLSNSEYLFSKKLKKKEFNFKSEYYLKEGNLFHHFDFAIFKNNKLKCLVEIDGEYFHGLLNDCDGKYINGYKDYIRWKLVPNKVKFLVIDSKRLKEGFKELQRILPMKYKDWKKEMLRSIPKNIEDAIPKFSKKRMLSDYEHLCKYRYYKNAFLGKSILLHFCKSRIIELLKNDWKSVRKTLYKSPVSSHNLLEGLDNFKNVSKLREKYRKKYKGVKEVIVKHHSPEKMLAICSLGKTYISKEPIDKESKRIIKFLKIKVIEK